MPGHSHQGRARVRPRARAQAARRGRLSRTVAGFPSSSCVVQPGWSDPETLTDQWAELGAPSARRARGGQAPLRRATWPTTADLCVTGWTADFPDPDGFFRGLFSDGRWPTSTATTRCSSCSRRHAPLTGPGRADAPLPRDRPPLGARAGRDPPARPTGGCCSLRRPWIDGVVAATRSGGRCLDQVVVSRQPASRALSSAASVPLPDEPEPVERQVGVDELDRRASAGRSARRARRLRSRGRRRRARRACASTMPSTWPAKP